jgi:hypothetical protein
MVRTSDTAIAESVRLTARRTSGAAVAASLLVFTTT